MENEDNGMETLLYGGQSIVNCIDYVFYKEYCSNIHRKSVSMYLHLTSHGLTPLMNQVGGNQTQLWNLKYFLLTPKWL